MLRIQPNWYDTAAPSGCGLVLVEFSSLTFFFLADIFRLQLHPLTPGLWCDIFLERESPGAMNASQCDLSSPVTEWRIKRLKFFKRQEVPYLTSCPQRCDSLKGARHTRRIRQKITPKYKLTLKKEGGGGGGEKEGGWRGGGGGGRTRAEVRRKG